MRFTGLVDSAALTAACLLRGAAGQDAPQPAAPPAMATADARGYGVGFVLGQGVRQGTRRDGVLVDPVLVARGFADGLKGNPPGVSREEMQRILGAVDEEMKARMVKRLMADSPQFKKLYEDNDNLSRRFHDLFGRQPDVVTLPSGLQYKVLRSATTGSSPGPDDLVTINARITLLDETVVFEGKGVELTVADAVRGGAEALQLMRPGARWQIVIPPDLAFGAAGRYPNIGPNETLVGMIELLQVKEGT